MSRVFVDVGVSLDGMLAGPNGRPGNPLGDGGLRIHEWMFATRAFREHLGLGDSGAAGPDDDLVRGVFARAGAHVMGRRMFDEGEVGWPEEAPFRAPVFVLTHHVREPWVRKGGTTFHFVAGGLPQALERARRAANGKDVRVCGGADTIGQAFEAGVVDDLTLHVAPILLGKGLRLFEGVPAERFAMRPCGTSHSPHVTHLHFTRT